MTAVDSVNASSLLSENSDVEEILIDFCIHHPDIPTLKSQHHVDTVVVLVRLHKAQGCKLVSLRLKAFSRLLRHLSFLVLQPQLVVNSPVVVATVRDCNEFVGTLLSIRVPSSLDNRNWDH